MFLVDTRQTVFFYHKDAEAVAGIEHFGKMCIRDSATLEEGWFYEGAGIYRHVWLNKTAPLHVAQMCIRDRYWW